MTASALSLRRNGGGHVLASDHRGDATHLVPVAGDHLHGVSPSVGAHGSDACPPPVRDGLPRNDAGLAAVPGATADHYTPTHHPGWVTCRDCGAILPTYATGLHDRWAHPA